MLFYDYKEIDNKIDRLNYKIRQAALQSNSVLKTASAYNGNKIPLQYSKKNRPDLSTVAILAAEEIKEYVEKIWNDSQTREKMLEKLQDELNENIRYLTQERNKLQQWLAQQKNIFEQKKGLEQSIHMVLDQLRDTEAKLQSVYDVYQKANEKGWKIIFYPALAFEAIKYTVEKKDKILEEQIRNRNGEYHKLFVEQQECLHQEAELNSNIQNSMRAIAQADTALITQKMELGQLKDMIVKGANAYVYYSMLGEKIRSAKERLVLEQDFCENLEKVSITQKELEDLLEIWEQNKNDKEKLNMQKGENL